MTDTDAAVTAPFVNALIRRAAALPDAEPDRRLLDGHAFGCRVDNPRLLALALEETAYRLISLTVDIAGGVRQGQILLCMPVPDAAARNPAGAPEAKDAGNAAQQPATLVQTVLGLEVDLTIALARLRMPLARLGQLRVGDTLDLEAARFDRAEVLKPGGGSLARGVLGQMDGRRALRILSDQSGEQTPRRRAADRDGLDQREPDPYPAEADMPPMPAEPPVTDPADADTAQAASLPDLSDLPELDLSELPELDDLPDLTERKAG